MELHDLVVEIRRIDEELKRIRAKRTDLKLDIQWANREIAVLTTMIEQLRADRLGVQMALEDALHEARETEQDMKDALNQ